LLRTEDGGDTWQPVLYSPSPTVRMKHPSLSPDGNGIVVTSNDDTLHVYLSSDFGATWSEHTPGEPNIIATQALPHGVFYAVGNSAGENYLRYSGPVGIPLHAPPTPWTYDLNTATLAYHGAERVSYDLYNANGQVVAKGVARTEVPFKLDVPTGLYTLSTIGATVSSMRLFVR
jgi:hypothetical protein